MSERGIDTEGALQSSAVDTVTAWLTAANVADRPALDAALPAVYEELRAMARCHMAREHACQTLDTTALVHEAYLKLVDQTKVPTRNRAYFFGAAARAMRQILVDQARRRQRFKRGGGVRPVTLDEVAGGGQLASGDAAAVQMLDVDAALNRLATIYPRQARVVECRFFGGLSVADTASALDLSPRTVKRDWSLARAWLARQLADDEPS